MRQHSDQALKPAVNRLGQIAVPAAGRWSVAIQLGIVRARMVTIADDTSRPVRPNLIVIKYLIIPMCAPLILAGFVGVFCVVSMARSESVYPAQPPLGMHEPLATGALGLLCLAIPLPYFAWAYLMRPSARFLGYSRRFWRILLVATFGTGLLLAGAFAGLMLTFFPG